MNPSEYYKKLNQQCEAVFDESLDKDGLPGDVHDLILNLSDWNSAISQYPSAHLINNAIEQIDMSCLLCLKGLHRQSFKSLRLAIEMICSSIYFSAYNLEYKEWLIGGYDIKWSVLTDKENGILSDRFCNAYFPECSKIVSPNWIQLKTIYRELSEMVHGNNQTWDIESNEIKYNDSLSKKYKDTIKKITIMINLMFCIRFLCELKDSENDSLDSHINDNLNHIEQIRIKIGGPV
jgi:hypothetical protein